MKRSEVRDLTEGFRLFQIDEWVEKEHISMRSLQPCDETASDNVHIVVQIQVFGPFGNQSVGYDTHLNKYLWCLVCNKRHLKSNGEQMVINGEVQYYCRNCYRNTELIRCPECG